MDKHHPARSSCCFLIARPTVMLIVTATTFITTSLAESLTLGEHVKDCVETVICHCQRVNERVEMSRCKYRCLNKKTCLEKCEKKREWEFECCKFSDGNPKPPRQGVKRNHKLCIIITNFLLMSKCSSKLKFPVDSNIFCLTNADSALANKSYKVFFFLFYILRCFHYYIYIIHLHCKNYVRRCSIHINT